MSPAQCNRNCYQEFRNAFCQHLSRHSRQCPTPDLGLITIQAKIHINFVCKSNATRTILAYMHLNGPFDCNKMPFEPMGCNVQVQEKTHTHGTWACHLFNGWCVQTLLEHYHTYKCLTKQQTATDSVTLFDFSTNASQIHW